MDDRSGRFVTLASGIEGDADALPIRARARVLGATLKAGATTDYRFAGEDRYGYLVPARGRVQIDGVELDARDGAAISHMERIQVNAIEDAELVLVDAAHRPDLG